MIELKLKIDFKKEKRLYYNERLHIEIPDARCEHINASVREL